MNLSLFSISPKCRLTHLRLLFSLSGVFGSRRAGSFFEPARRLCFRLMEHISVISCRNPINLYITEKLLFGNFKYIKRTNALFSDLCFPSSEFQVRRVAFEGTNYYLLIFDTI